MRALSKKIGKISHRRIVITIFMSCLIIFFVMNTNARYSCSGDEPHYLLVTHSLLYDGDLELDNNYKNKDWLFFKDSNKLDPHWIEGKNGKFYTKHGMGLSVLILPAYVLGRGLSDHLSEPVLEKFNLKKSSACYRTVSLFMIVITCVLIVNLYLFCFRCSQNKPLSLLVALLVAFCTPLLYFSNLIFTEIPAALILILIFREYIDKDQFRNPVSLLLTGLGIAFLPWLHFKYAILSVLSMLFFLEIFIRLKTGKNLVALFYFPSFMSLIFLGVFQLVGIPIFHTHGGFNFSFHAIEGLLGLVLDQEFGLFFYAPAFVFSFLGLRQLYKANKNLLYFMISCFFGLYFLSGLYKEWYGGWCPPARYLVPVVPLLSLPLLYTFLYYRSKIFYWLFCIILDINLLFNAVLWSKPKLMWNFKEGSSRLLDHFSKFLNINLSKLFPSFIEPKITSYLVALLWIIAITLLIYCIKRDHKPIDHDIGNLDLHP